MADPASLPPREGSPLSSALGKMLLAREKRPRPARDEKILADWNGLAIGALAIASRAFRSPGCLEAAGKAAEFILSRLMTPDGRVCHCFEGGEATVAGLADDYACLCWGLLELHRASLDTRFLEKAAGLGDTLIAHFLDAKEGGFFSTPDDGESLIARLKPVHDGFTPAANSLALANLLRLARLTGRTGYSDIARDLTGWYLRERSSSASASAWMMDSLALALIPSIEVVVVGDPDAPDTRELLAVIDGRDLPGLSVLLKKPSGDPALNTIAPFTRSFTAREGRATAYVCRNHACELPVTDPGSLARILDGSTGSGSGENP